MTIERFKNEITSLVPEISERRLVHPRYYYRLAKLYERKGLAKKAIENHEKFLGLYKDADPDLTEFMDTKKRLVGLN